MEKTNLPENEPVEETNLPEKEPVEKTNLRGNKPVEGEPNLPRSVPDKPDKKTSLPDNDNLPVLSDLPECDKANVPGNEGQEEITEETEEQVDTDNPIRRSERNRQPPRRLDYTELGTPLVTVVKSLFQGLTTVWNDVVNESETPAHRPVLSPEVITI